jgi:hypothetical protein
VAVLGIVGLSACTGSSGADRQGVAPPPADARFDYQLGGAYPPEGDVEIVVRDRTAEADPGRYSVCYVNAFQTQPGATEVPEHLLVHDGSGARVEDPDWPGEYLLDISTPDRRAAVVDLVGRWIDGCARDGFDAVEPDNLDSWTRSQGFLDRADAVATARLLVERAHDAGLAIAQKNAAELAGEELGFDFAITEDCSVFAECATYGETYDVVLDVEYDEGAFSDACDAGGEGASLLHRDLQLVTPGEAGYVARWCDG